MIADASPSPRIAPPSTDPDSAFFWAGLREQRVLIQRCAQCSRARFPAMPSCPWCAARDASIEEISGTGQLYSWIVVRRAFDPAFEREVPYTIATVDFDAGGRVVGRLVAKETPQFGMRLAPVFHEHPDWTELRFRPL
jgi:uncharacterized OB-fold protein